VAGLRQIDHLVVTHYHLDHYGGAAALSRVIPIGHVHDNGQFEGLREPPDQEYREFKAGRRSVISPGDELRLAQLESAGAPPLRVRCLAARQQIVAVDEAQHAENPHCGDYQPKPEDLSDNANSVVLLVSLGRFDFFDAGDLTWNVEHALVCPRNRVGAVDVYQVTHHGLDSSNNPVLLRALEPTVAVMNNGVTKGCEPYTFAALRETPSLQAVYQVHKNLRPDGDHNNAPDEQIANLQEDCQANYIHLHVEPDGEEYTVSIPGRGHERTFRTK
jgi:competence protein ComEC